MSRTCGGDVLDGVVPIEPRRHLAAEGLLDRVAVGQGKQNDASRFVPARATSAAGCV